MKVKIVLSLAVLLTSLLSYSSGFKIPNGPVGGSLEKTWQKLFKVPNSPKKPFEDILRARGINYRSPRKTKILSDPSNSPFPVPSFHGYVQVGAETENDLFYWMFPSQNNAEEAPLLLYLGGGPGASSESPLFWEVGPFNITLDNKVVLNPESWNQNANLLFVDQPIGVGFSHGKDSDLCRTEECVASRFGSFMQIFLNELFQEFKGRKVYTAGESYAGNYIPFIASHLLDLQLEYLNLAGIAIGNGWINPPAQYPYYPTYANEPENRELTQMTTELFEQVSGPILMCEDLMHFANPNLVKPVWKYCEGWNSKIYLNSDGSLKFNIYDIRMKCSPDGDCYNWRPIYNYLRSPQIANALQTDKQWTLFAPKVATAMGMIDENVDASPPLAKILNAKIPTLIYYGDKDYLCNWLGGLAAVTELQWDGKEEFKKSKFEDDGTFGKSRTAANLKFLRVFNAGHLVPMDQPEGARQMIEEFMGISFN